MNIYNNFYNATQLLSMKDINGKTPEIYLVSSNRSGGKTTAFRRVLFNRFLKKTNKFMVLYRTKTEVPTAAMKLFRVFGDNFYPGCVLTQKTRDKGSYADLFLNNKHCGYAVAINASDKLKDMSQLFSDTSSMLFDEMQPENSSSYLPNELEKIFSLHVSVSRGKDTFYRYVPLYLLSNNTSLLNPYFQMLGISNRLKKDTKFLKGDGWVFENAFIEKAAQNIKESAFSRAFQNLKYADFSTENVYLNDNTCMIEKIKDVGEYVCTLKYNSVLFSIRRMKTDDLMYCSRVVDNSFPICYAVDKNDISNGFIMYKQSPIISGLRNYFCAGKFRFSDLVAKEAGLLLLSY